MKKIVLALFVCAISFATTHAQESLFHKGDRVLNLGIGLGRTYNIGTYYSTGIPPISASLEMGMVDNFLDVENLSVGVGGYVGFSTYKYEYTGFGYNYGWNYTELILGARGVLHYPLVENLDTYTGLLVGPRISIASEFGDFQGNEVSASGSGLAFSYFFGARYYFSENIAVMGELGYGISWLTIGVAVKL